MSIWTRPKPPRIPSIAFGLKFNSICCSTLRPYKYYWFLMKIQILRGDVHDISAETKSMMLTSASFLAEISVRSPQKLYIFFIYKNIFWLKVSKKKLFNFENTSTDADRQRLGQAITTCIAFKYLSQHKPELAPKSGKQMHVWFSLRSQIKYFVILRSHKHIRVQ